MLGPSLHIRTKFEYPPPSRGSCPRGGTLGRWGCPGDKKKFKHGNVAYQIDGDDGQNAKKNFTWDKKNSKHGHVAYKISKITVTTYTCRYEPLSLDLPVVVSQTTRPPRHSS